MTEPTSGMARVLRHPAVAAVPRQALLLFVGLVATGLVLVIAHSSTPQTLPTGVLLCDGQNGRPAHSLTTWHPLVVYNSDGSVLCSYGHTHGAQPDTAELTAKFGPLPEGQSISYAHATPNENLDSGSFPNKHRAYKWLTRVTSCPAGNTDWGMTAYRELVHMDGSLGASIRFHSFWIQAELTNCATGEVGQFYGGAWIDQAFLIAGDTRVFSASDPPAGCILNGDRKQEDGLGQFTYPLPNSVWYGASSRDDNGSSPVCDDNPGQNTHWALQQNMGIDQFGPVDPTNPTTPLLYDARYYRDDHIMESISSDGVSLLMPPNWECAAGQTCGPIIGFSNSFGMVVNGCTVETPQCVPFKAQNIHGKTDGSFTTFGTFGTFGGFYDGSVLGPDGTRGYYIADPVLGTAPPASTPPAPTNTPVVVPTATNTSVPTSTPTSTIVPVTMTPVVATNTPIGATPVPTATQAPFSTSTSTPVPTNTAVPTDTPVSVLTSTPISTTVIPTSTPVATDTPTAAPPTAVPTSTPRHPRSTATPTPQPHP